ncbi:MAG: TolC family protein, partial [Chlorobi bacterium]|nr:TolC family protein [Chlorobiota bacterium]
MANAQYKGMPKIFTLKDCINTALKNNPEVLLSGARIDAANADIKGAFGQYLPNLSVNGGYSRHLNPSDSINASYGGVSMKFANPSSPNSYNMNANLGWTIFDGFSRGEYYSQAQDRFRSANLDADYIDNKIVRDVYRSFIDVVKKKKILEARAENMKLGEKELERIKAQKEAGIISIGAVYSQEADLGNKEFELINAENEFNVSKALLLTVMGMNPNASADFSDLGLLTEVSDVDVLRFRNSISEYSRAIDFALDNRDDFKSTQYSIQAAQSGISAARSGYFPRVSSYMSWGWNNSQLTEFDQGRSFLGLSFSLPVFDQFQTNTRIQNATLQLRQAEIQQFQLEQSIRSSVQAAYLNLESVEKQLDITARSLKASERNFESAKERFKVGS